MFGRKSRNDDDWQTSADAVDTAYDAYTDACRTYGDDSPEASAARERADVIADGHFDSYGNPYDGQPRTC